MQQFTVPQFIDVENKIFGPITTRQFLIILSAGILVAICYKIFDFSLFVMLTVVISAIAGVLSFVKVNGRPFHFFILNAVQTLRRPRLRIWDNRAVINEQSDKVLLTKVEEKPVTKEYYKKSRLAELALVVDTKGRYQGE